MQPECYHAVVRQTLSDPKVVELLNLVDKTVCNQLPASVMSPIQRRTIMSPLVIVATGELIDALNGSRDKEKMTIFLDVLHKNQSIHADEIKEIYSKNLAAHTCDQCLPEPPTEDPMADPEESQDDTKVKVETNADSNKEHQDGNHTPKSKVKVAVEVKPKK